MVEASGSARTAARLIALAFQALLEVLGPSASEPATVIAMMISSGPCAPSERRSEEARAFGLLIKRLFLQHA